MAEVEIFEKIINKWIYVPIYIIDRTAFTSLYINLHYH